MAGSNRVQSARCPGVMTSDSGPHHHLRHDVNRGGWPATGAAETLACRTVSSGRSRRLTPTGI